MNKLTAKEIIEKLSSTHLTIDDFAHGEKPWLKEHELVVKEAERIAKGKKELKYYWEDSDYKRVSKEATQKANEYFDNLVGKYEEVEQHGGEGEGDNWYSIKYFKDHDVYIKVQGFYASYHGTSFDGWDDCKEVRPVEKTITVYE